MDKTAETKPIRILKKTKSNCSDDVAAAIYSSSKEERRQSYDEALEHFKTANSRKGDPVCKPVTKKDEKTSSS
eukprot:g1469.t1